MFKDLFPPRPLKNISNRKLQAAKKLLVSVPMKDTISHLTCFSPEKNVFANALVAYELYGRSALKDSLADYYASSSHNCVADIWGEGAGPLNDIPAMGVVMPWFCENSVDKLSRISVNSNAGVPLSVEAANYGLDPCSEYGWQFFGPVSEGVLELECNRLVEVYDSIKKNGYSPSLKGHIHGYLLASDSERVVVIMGGKHRYAALIALGQKYIPVILKAKSCKLYTHKRDIKQWPQVVNGAYDLGLAEKIFCRQMGGSK